MLGPFIALELLVSEDTEAAQAVAVSFGLVAFNVALAVGPLVARQQLRR